MKLRSLKLLMALVMIMQAISFTSVFADTTTTDKIVYDFSDASQLAGIVSKSNNTPNVNDFVLVKGQLGKAPNDGSIRLYTMGGTATGANLTQRLNLDTSGLSAVESDEYIHLSFEFLNEDGYSKLAFYATAITSDGTIAKDKQIVTQSRTASAGRQINMMPQSNGKTNNTSLDNGRWHRFDVYFNPNTTAGTKFFLDGFNVSGDSGKDVEKWTAVAGAGKNIVKDIPAVRLEMVPNTSTLNYPTAVQFDNIVVEKVKSVPAQIDYRIYGEKFDFEDGMSIDASGKYCIEYGYGSTTLGNVRKHEYKLRPYATSTSPTRRGDFTFQKPSSYTKVAGALGKPSWDNAIHFAVPSDEPVSTGTTNNRIVYQAGIREIRPGDTVHYSFEYAHVSDDVVNEVRFVSTAFEGYTGSVNQTHVFKVWGNGQVQMFGEAVANIELNKWYKFDLVFKMDADESAYPLVDGYINGEKVLSDYEWDLLEGYYVPSYIGNLVFGDLPNVEYYLDNIAVSAVASSDVAYDLAAGYELTSANDNVFVNNAEKIIAINSDAEFTGYSDLFTNTDNFVVYNNDGTIIYSGKVDSNTVIQGTNMLGAGNYYNVGYKSDKLEIGDIEYSSDAQTLKSQAEVGFDIREDYNAPVASYPTSGVVIIALYNGDELVECTPVPYSNLTAENPVEAVINNVSSIEGKTVKVFIFDSTDGITPIIKNKVK